MKRRYRLSWPLVLYWLILLGALYVFAELAGDVYEQERFAFDDALLTWFNAQQTPLLTSLARGVTFIGSGVILTPAALLLGVWLWRGSRRQAVFFLLSVAGATVLNLTAKAFFARARPALFDRLSPASNFSFPSGHAMISAAFFVALGLLFWQRYPQQRVWTALWMSLTPLAIGITRPYLQVHYPSDILAGWALAVAWVLGVFAWFRRRQAGLRRSEASGG